MIADICQVRQAEIENDIANGMTFEQEQAHLNAQAELWKRVYARLLEGKTVDLNGKSANLAERLADQYQEFSDMVDADIDFMAEFQAGWYGTRMGNIIKNEARTLASIIVG